jgi:hypothetical protein
LIHLAWFIWPGSAGQQVFDAGGVEQAKTG